MIYIRTFLADYKRCKMLKNRRLNKVKTGSGAQLAHLMYINAHDLDACVDKPIQ